MNKKPKWAKRCLKCHKVMATWSRKDYCFDCSKEIKKVQEGQLLEQIFKKTWYYKNVILKEQMKGG